MPDTPASTRDEDYRAGWSPMRRLVDHYYRSIPVVQANRRQQPWLATASRRLELPWEKAALRDVDGRCEPGATPATVRRQVRTLAGLQDLRNSAGFRRSSATVVRTANPESRACR